MSVNQDIADGLAEVEGDVRNEDAEATAITFTWSGTAYPCTGSAPDESKSLELGYALNANLMVNIRRELFTAALPATKQTGVYSVTGKTYRIDSIAYPPGFLQLTLIDPTKGV